MFKDSPENMITRRGETIRHQRMVLVKSDEAE